MGPFAMALRRPVEASRRLSIRPLADLPPDAARNVKTEISAGVLITGFTVVTGPFTGLVLRGQFHATPFQLACASSAGAAFMLLSLLWAQAVRRSGAVASVVWPGVLARAAFLCVPFITTAWGFVGVLTVASLMTAVAGPAYSALVQQVYPREQRGRALAAVRMIGSIAGIALAPLAGLLLTHVSFRVVFPVAAALGVLGTLRLLRMRPVAPGCGWGASCPAGGVAAALRGDPAFARLLLVSQLFGFGIWLQIPANPMTLVDVLHGSALQMGIAAAAGSIAGFVGNARWGALVDRRPSRRVLSLVYTAGSVSPLLYLLGFAVRSPWLIVGTAASDAVVATGLDIVAMVAVTDLAGPARAAQYMGVYLTLAGVRGVVGPLLGAYLIQRGGLALVYVLAAAVMLVSAWTAARQAESTAPAESRATATPPPVRVPERATAV